jgi:hypothetical protein
MYTAKSSEMSAIHFIIKWYQPPKQIHTVIPITYTQSPVLCPRQVPEKLGIYKK